MHCAIYTRLSKEDADKPQSESESIQNQKALLCDYAAQRGWEIYEVYCDEDYSGADRLRPDFNRMLRAAREGRFQILLCKSQSRFTRDMEMVEKYLHGLFPLWGVRFIAVADNADTEVKGNKKARQINGLVNEWYLEDLSENIRTVLDMKRRQGDYIGGCPIYGYQKDPQNKNRLIIEPEAAEVVRQIFRWSLAGYGKQRIAFLLNTQGIVNPTSYKLQRGWAAGHTTNSSLWSKTTVWRILRNEMYTGVMVQGRTRKASYKSKTQLTLPPEQWFRVEGTHEAIIDRTTFQAVQEGMALRSREDGSGEVHPLSGLVYCMDCGAVMSKTSNAKRGAARICYLRCKRYADSGREKQCTRHAIRLDALEALVQERLGEYLRQECPLETLEVTGQAAPLPGRQDKALRGEIERRTAALRQLYLDKAAGLLTAEEFGEVQGQLLAQRRRLEALLESDEKTPEQTPPMTEGLPRGLAAALIERIDIGERDRERGEQTVRIAWKF